MKNPFKDAHACLVYRRKYLPGEYEKENQAKELYHWRTFGYYDSIYIVGGGAKNAFLNRLTEEASGKKVIALPMEATAIGNLKVQMEADK